MGLEEKNKDGAQERRCGGDGKGREDRLELPEPPCLSPVLQWGSAHRHAVT